MSNKTFRTFKRSCTSWRSWAKARKITVNTGLTFADAQDACKRFNDNRTAAQIRKGTFLEFTAE